MATAIQQKAWKTLSPSPYDNLSHSRQPSGARLAIRAGAVENTTLRGTHMRIDRRADPSFDSTECPNPHDVNWAPECQTRHPPAQRPRESRKTPTPRTLDVIGPLEVRLTRQKRDVRRLQRLRYRVFFKHGGAVADIATRITRRDRDPFDSICDHLRVLEHRGTH